MESVWKQFFMQKNLFLNCETQLLERNRFYMFSVDWLNVKTCAFVPDVVGAVLVEPPVATYSEM